MGTWTTALCGHKLDDRNPHRHSPYRKHRRNFFPPFFKDNFSLLMYVYVGTPTPHLRAFWKKKIWGYQTQRQTKRVLSVKKGKYFLCSTFLLYPPQEFTSLGFSCGVTHSYEWDFWGKYVFSEIMALHRMDMCYKRWRFIWPTNFTFTNLVFLPSCIKKLYFQGKMR